MLAKFIQHVATRWTRPDATALDQVPAMAAAGRTGEAEAVLRGYLRHHPDDANALNYLGLICHQRGDYTEAVGLIAGAVERAPDVGFFHANLGEALRAAGQLGRAEKHARESVTLAPENPDFAYNLANIFFQRNAYADALPWAERALAARPDQVEALLLAAKLDFELGHIASALTRYRRALDLRPEDPETALALARTQAWACEWGYDISGLSRVLARWAAQPLAPEFAGLNPFVAYQFDLPQPLRKAVADAHASRILSGLGASPTRFDFSARAGQPRLRIGYVSADFHGHPTMHLMRGLFRLHDRRRFEVSAYSIGANDGSAYRREVVADAEHFHDIRGEDARATAQRIFADGIDILVDLKGFTFEARPEIFARRPAPLNVAWLGYPGTTGTGLNDYAIVDHVVAPSGHEVHFGEKLVRMPHTYQINDNAQEIAAAVPSRHELGLPEGGFVFACFNHVYKIDTTMFGCWMRILKRIPGSVLWLYQSNTEARARLEAAASQLGVDPGRLVFSGTLPKPEHLARLGRADLFLDTRLINAHTGASDALWAGLPLISCPQQDFPSRVGASLLCAAGLPQLVCSSLDEYEVQAVRLAGAPDELQALRRQLLTAHDKLPLFDTPRFVRNLERAYEFMWRRHLAGQQPAAFDVTEPA